MVSINRSCVGSHRSLKPGSVTTWILAAAAFYFFINAIILIKKKWIDLEPGRMPVRSVFTVRDKPLLVLLVTYEIMFISSFLLNFVSNR